MKLFSYIVAQDYGFAPNPHFGLCTLATCKPGIRRAAGIGDWIIGTGAKSRYDLAGHLIYAMKVSEVLDFNGYWRDPRFASKRPLLNGSLKQMYGDNIYHRRGKRWVQADSHHSREGGRPNRKNIERDTGTDRVLVAEKFVYFGAEAVTIPKRFRPFKRTGRDVCCAARGYQALPQEMAVAFERWLDERGEWGLQGMPLEYSRQKKASPSPRKARRSPGRAQGALRM